MAKVRVHELAKELEISSKTAVSILQEIGEFVRSASSTIEAPVVRKLRNEVERRKSSGGRLEYPAPVPTHEDARALRLGEPLAVSNNTLDWRREFWSLDVVASHLGKETADVLHVLDTRTYIYGTRADSLVGPMVVSKLCELYGQDADRVLSSLKEKSIGSVSTRQPMQEAFDSLPAEHNDLTVIGPGLFATHKVGLESGAVPAEAADISPMGGSEQGLRQTHSEPQSVEKIRQIRTQLHSKPLRGPSPVPEQDLAEGYLEFSQGATGVTFQDLLCPYLIGARHILITDPYIRVFHQARNLMELLVAILKLEHAASPIRVELRTSKERKEDSDKVRIQERYLERIRDSFEPTKIRFSYVFHPDLHARSIVTDTGWKIKLDRGLDIYPHVSTSAMDLDHHLQEFRKVNSFDITYLRI